MPFFYNLTTVLNFFQFFISSGFPAIQIPYFLAFFRWRLTVIAFDAVCFERTSGIPAALIDGHRSPIDAGRLNIPTGIKAVHAGVDHDLEKLSRRRLIFLDLAMILIGYNLSAKVYFSHE